MLFVIAYNGTTDNIIKTNHIIKKWRPVFSQSYKVLTRTNSS